jgi:tetratricopeptide (TPR) repeat protein
LLRLIGDKAPLSFQLSEARAALWIEPTNPDYRDFYGATLVSTGETDQGLKEITRSVVDSPSLNTHVYLRAEVLPLLSGEEQSAVEDGFRQALARDYPEALNSLAEFYAKLNRFADQGALYEEAALKETDSAKKAELLIKGGLAYLHAARAEATEVRGQKSAVEGATRIATNATNAINQRSEVRGQKSAVEGAAGSKEQGAGSGGVGTVDGRRTTEAGPRSSVSGQPGKGKESEIRGRRSEVSKLHNATNANHAINATNAERDNATNAKNATSGPRNSETARSETTAPNPQPITPNTQNPTPNAAFENAERLFHSASTVNPADPKPYQHLVTAIFGVRKDLDGAKDVVSNGIKSGAPALPLYLSLAEAGQKAGSPEETKAALKSAKAEVDKLIKNGESPHTLYIALADGARRAGDREQESAALLKALDLHPRSPETLSRLAGLYSEQRNFDRAALYLNRIANINPDSAEVFYRIAQAEESRYRFAAAGQAYARAVELAPDNANYRDRYEEFKARVDRNRVTGDGGPGLTPQADGRQATGGRELTSQVTERRETGDRAVSSRIDGRREPVSQR